MAEVRGEPRNPTVTFEKSGSSIRKGVKLGRSRVDTQGQYPVRAVVRADEPATARANRNVTEEMGATVAADSCENHAFDMAEDLCGSCGRGYCSECLVYPFGAKKPPLCKSCAVSAAGIRSNAARPRALSKRELRKRMKARKKEAKRRGRQPEPVEEPTPVVASMDWEAVEAEAAEPAPSPAPEHATPEPAAQSAGTAEDPFADSGLPPLVPSQSG